MTLPNGWSWYWNVSARTWCPGHKTPDAARRQGFVAVAGTRPVEPPTHAELVLVGGRW